MMQLMVGMHEVLCSSSTNNNKLRREVTLFEYHSHVWPFFLKEILTELPAPFLDIVMCCWQPINTAPNYFHRQVARVCRRALGESLTSFALNSLQHPFTNIVKCETSRWPCLCKGTFFPWAKIASLNGFQLLRGRLPVQIACSLSWHFKGLLPGLYHVSLSRPHADGKATFEHVVLPSCWALPPRERKWLLSATWDGQRTGGLRLLDDSWAQHRKAGLNNLIKTLVSTMQARLRGLETVRIFSSVNLCSSWKLLHSNIWKSCGYWATQRSISIWYSPHRKQMCMWREETGQT